MTKVKTIDLTDQKKKEEVNTKNNDLKDTKIIHSDFENKIDCYKNSQVILKIDQEDGRMGELVLSKDISVEDTCRKFCRRYRLNYGNFGKNQIKFCNNELYKMKEQEKINQSTDSNFKSTVKGNSSKDKISSANKTFDRLWLDASEGKKYKNLIQEHEFNVSHPFRPDLSKRVAKARNKRTIMNSKKFSKENLIARNTLDDILQMDKLKSKNCTSSRFFKNKSQMIDAKTTGYSPAQKKRALDEGNLYGLAYPYDKRNKDSSARRHSCMGDRSVSNGMRARASVYTNAQTTNEKWFSQTNNEWFHPKTLKKSSQVYDQDTYFERSLSRSKVKYLENRKGIYGLGFKTNDLHKKTVSSIQDCDFRKTYTDKDGKLTKNLKENKFATLIGLANLLNENKMYDIIIIENLLDKFDQEIKCCQELKLLLQMLCSDPEIVIRTTISSQDFIGWVQKNHLSELAHISYEQLIKKKAFIQSTRNSVKHVDLNRTEKSYHKPIAYHVKNHLLKSASRRSSLNPISKISSALQNIAYQPKKPIEEITEKYQKLLEKQLGSKKYDLSNYQ